MSIYYVINYKININKDSHKNQNNILQPKFYIISDDNIESIILEIKS